MKKLVLAALIVGLMFAGATAGYALELGGQAVDIDVGTTYVSKYIFRGVDTFANDDGGIQPYVTVTVHPMDTNLAMGFWGSYAGNEGHENLDEQDYWVTLDKDVSDLVNIGMGYTYYDFFNGGSQGDINEFQWFVGLSNIPYLSENIQLLQDYPISLGYLTAYAFGTRSLSALKAGIDDGWYHEASLGIEVPLPGTEGIPFQEEGLTLAYDHTFGWYAGSQLGLSGNYWTQSWGIPFALPGNLALTPTLSYQVSANGNESSTAPHAPFNTEDEFYFTLDLSTSF